MSFKADGNLVFVLSDGGLSPKMRCQGHLSQSLWLREINGAEAGDPPVVDLEIERSAGEFVRAAIVSGVAVSVHDVSDGGIIVAAAEMALAGNRGLAIGSEWLDGTVDLLFGEDQGRYLIETADFERLIEDASAAGLVVECLGRIDHAAIYEDHRADGVCRLNAPLADLRAANERFFREWMEG